MPESTRMSTAAENRVSGSTLYRKISGKHSVCRQIDSAGITVYYRLLRQACDFSLFKGYLLMIK